MQDAPTNRRRTYLAVAAGLAAAIVLLRRFPPETVSFYPRCPIHALTGLLCPGCGATRALAALARGHLAEALHHNPLVIVALTLILGHILAQIGGQIVAQTLDRTTPRRIIIPARRRRSYHSHPIFIASALVCATAFTLWRNLI